MTATAERPKCLTCGEAFDPTMSNANRYAAYCTRQCERENCPRECRGSDPCDWCGENDADEQLQDAADAVAHSAHPYQDEHEAADPHCTCNDCIDSHERRLGK